MFKYRFFELIYQALNVPRREFVLLGDTLEGQILDEPVVHNAAVPFALDILTDNFVNSVVRNVLE